MESINESLRIIYGIKSNKSKENIVLLNSAAALMVGGDIKSFKRRHIDCERFFKCRTSTKTIRNNCQEQWRCFKVGTS